MKKSSRSSILVVLLIPFIILGIVLWWFVNLQPVNPSNKEKIYLVVSKGDSLAEISGQLANQGLIRDQFHFKILVFLMGISKKMQAGGYYLNPSMDERQIAVNLTKGTNDRWVTIVEGLRNEQIGEFLIKQGFAINPDEWMVMITSDNLEGKLFPDSYLFPKGATQAAILKIFNRNFQKKVVEGLGDELSRSSFNLEEVLTLASMVEREANHNVGRTTIAGILIKRLQNGWPLQVDATVQYAVASQKCSIFKSPCDWWSDKLSPADLQIKSKYNTYLNRGLPPGPICSPGLASIKAVLQPKDSPYWYYLSDKNGVMHYAKTSSEHQANIQKYLK